MVQLPCLVTMDTGARVTVARLGIATRWPERQWNQCMCARDASVDKGHQTLKSRGGRGIIVEPWGRAPAGTQLSRIK